MGQETSGDRFAAWARVPARLVLVVLALLLAASALVRIEAPAPRMAPATVAPGEISGKAERLRDDDLAVYDAVIARLRHGEGYYHAVAEEHRRVGFPLRPGLAVRLPTLAWIEAALGDTGVALAAFALVAATLLAWWRRLGEEPGAAALRPVAMALLVLGMSLQFNRWFFVLHELWAGGLLALAFGLHRPGRKWGAALAAAALALAIREHALPFVLLMAAMALWRRDRAEALAWSGLALAFLALLAWHLQLVGQEVLPTDQAGPGWLTFRGLSGWLSALVEPSNLRLLPHWLAGPLVVLMLLGWAGWSSPAGTFGTLLYLGYGLFLMIAGRVENYYWGAVVAPAMGMGLAFAPRALRSLWKRAFPFGV